MLKSNALLRYLIYTLLGIMILASGLIAYLIWFQPPFHLPKPTGQYAVGVKAYHWVDETRKETLSNDPEHPNRELMVKVWYPAAGKLPQKPSTPIAPYLIHHLKKTKPIVYYLGFSRYFYSFAKPNEPLAKEKIKYPVIIYSHGSGGVKESGSAQCEELASHGYVVVGISHTYDSYVVQFPDGRLIERAKSSVPRNFVERRKSIAKKTEIKLSDVQFVLNKLNVLANDKSSKFYKRLNLEKIGMFGQSAGGSITIQACRREPRIKAGVNLDGSLLGSEETNPTGPVNKPLMFILARETTKMFDGPMDKKTRKVFNVSSPKEERMVRERYLDGIKKVCRSFKQDSYIFVLDGAGHLDLTNTTLLKHASPLGKPLIKLGVMQGGLGMSSIDGFRANEIVCTYLVNFFDKYLKGKPSELLNKKQRLYPEMMKLKPSADSITSIPQLVFRPQTENESFDYVMRIIENSAYWRECGYNVKLPEPAIFKKLYENPNEIRKVNRDELKKIFITELQNKLKWPLTAKPSMDAVKENRARATINRVLERLLPLQKNWGFELKPKYEIVFAPYGAETSYNSSPKTGTIRFLTQPIINQPGWIEISAVHEILNIGILENIIQKHGLNQWQIKRIIDLIFKLYLNDIFPYYKPNPINEKRGDRRIDKFVNKQTIVHNLPAAIERFKGHLNRIQ